MDFYEKMGVRKLINASETYTKLGGSLMAPETLEAMCQAASGFVDMDELLDRVCERAARLTHNDGAFVTTGAGGGVVLTAAACIIEANLDGLAPEAAATRRGELLECFPFIGELPKNEILVFKGGFRESVPYWRLLRLTGARIVDVEPSCEGIRAAVSPRTAAFYLFPAPLYERDVMTCEEALPILRALGVRCVVDAAAQLPPADNLWYYTRKLGADAAVFSGGKHIRGPQSTGLIVGRSDLTALCRQLASPHERIGRGFKTGKEELAGFITALETFVTMPRAIDFDRQQRLLERMAEAIRRDCVTAPGIELIRQGRLGTDQPLLLLTLPDGLRAEDCNRYTRSLPEPIDVGVYSEEFHMPADVMFLNAYNIKDEAEADAVARAVTGFVNAMMGRAAEGPPIRPSQSRWANAARQREDQRCRGKGMQGACCYPRSKTAGQP